jgi:hypothetical protein
VCRAVSSWARRNFDSAEVGDLGEWVGAWTLDG